MSNVGEFKITDTRIEGDTIILTATYRPPQPARWVKFNLDLGRVPHKLEDGQEAWVCTLA